MYDCFPIVVPLIHVRSQVTRFSLLTYTLPSFPTHSHPLQAHPSNWAFSRVQMQCPPYSSRQEAPLSATANVGVMQSIQAPVVASVPTPPLSTPMSQALSLSKPVLGRLVSRITARHFVEMWDLLGDKISLTQRMEEIHSSLPTYILPAVSRPHLREVTSLPSWIYCFLTYVSVLTSDTMVQDRLTYARLIIREALRHGRQG